MFSQSMTKWGYLCVGLMSEVEMNDEPVKLTLRRDGWTEPGLEVCCNYRRSLISHVNYC